MSPHSGRKKSATHSYQCVFNISGCTIVWLPVFGVLTYAQMLMHAIADGGCTDSVRGPALEVDSERERVLDVPRTRTRVSIAPGFSVGRCTN